MLNSIRKFVRFILSSASYLKAKIFNPAASIGKDCRINFSASFCGNRPIRIGNNCSIRNYALLSPGHGSIEIGDNCAIGAFNYIDGNGGVVIGNNVHFGPHCAVYSADHTFEDRNVPICSQPLKYKTVIFEDDIWVGSHSVITAGVRIGSGSVIAAGSVVTKDVAPYSVVAGVPAKLKRYRS